jgi:hypothetical protein
MLGENLMGATPLDDSDEEDNRKKQLEDARKNALYYGWEYFKYHAQQRQAVFRFYLILAGAALAGLVASYSNQYAGLAANRWMIGLSLILLSLMFWRLDVRSYRLVKVAEAFLLHEERMLARDLSTESIRLTFNADANKGRFWSTVRLATFRQVYGWIFLFVGLCGLLISGQSLPAFMAATRKLLCS